MATKSFSQEGLGVDDLVATKSILHDGSKKTIWQPLGHFFKMVLR